MPPVRDASTKPSAATVLPAPVACSNQKRRAAPASSSCGVGGGLLLGLLGRVPVERLLVGQLVALDLDLAGVQLLVGGLAVAVPGAADLELGLERDQRAGERIDLVGGQRGAVHEVRLVLRQQSLEAEDQRVVAPPLDRGLAATRLDLLQRGVERDRRAPSSASAVAGSSPSSTNGSRANSSARFRSSPDTGEASATELLSATVGRFSVRGRGVPSCSFRSQRGTPVVRRCRSSESRASNGPGP